MSGAPPVTSAKPCPICSKPADVGFAPFCSKRCADVDLHRWLKGAYAVPDEDAEPNDGLEEGDR